jgi:hypothetical protein
MLLTLYVLICGANMSIVIGLRVRGMNTQIIAMRKITAEVFCTFPLLSCC